MTYDRSFGQWLIARRKALRLQRTELAAQLGCAVITLRKIETDERRPSQQLAELLADRLGIGPADRAIFIRVARGELIVDRLPELPITTGDPAAVERPGPLPAQPVSRPPSRPLVRTNLPSLLTSFVGRNQELDALPTLIQTQRLVTLTGVGGVGKTRLALELGMRLVRDTPTEIIRDGIWLIELAALAEPSLVVQVIARLLQIPEQPDRTPIELLQEYLADKQLVLILDNCEHLVDACAALSEQLLQRCWQLRILATSREPLRVPGEHAYSVAPLTLPAAHEQRPEQILGSAAAQLFVARMHTHPGAPTADLYAAGMIAQICRQLDGIPLALELAAPLAHSMPLAEIAAQLHNQMRILTNTYRTAIPRHQTMHSALIWSYRLLAAEEQALLASVAVFSGGWTLEAAQAICSEYPPERMLPILNDLIVKSLVLQEELHGQRRYRLLEPVRQFALMQLQASGMEQMARRRHAQYFLSLAEQMGPARDTPHEREWLQRLEPERDNIRAVNTWAITHAERELAHRLNGALFAFWIYRSNVTEINHWYDLVLAIPVVTDGRPQTRSAVEAEAAALNAAGYSAGMLKPLYQKAQSRFERELALRRKLGEPRGIAGALRGCSFMAMVTGYLDQAQQLSEQAMATSHSVDDQWGAAWSLYDLGYIALVRGDVAAAQALLELAIPQLRAQEINWGLYRGLIALGHALYMAGQTNQARTYYHEALWLRQHMDYQQHVADIFEGLAGIAAVEHQPAQAALLFGAAEAYRRATATPRWQPQEPWYERGIALASSQIDPQQWQAAWQQGYAMSLDQAVAYALELQP